MDKSRKTGDGTELEGKEKEPVMDGLRKTGDGTELVGEGKGLAMDSADRLQAKDEFQKIRDEMAPRRKEKEIYRLRKTEDIMESEGKEKELADDEFRKPGDATELEGKAKGLAMESADKLQQKDDTAMEDYAINQEDQKEPAGKLQGAGAFDLKVSKTESKLCKLRETKRETRCMGGEAQIDRKAGRGGRIPRRCKDKTEPLHCEGPPEDTQSSIDHTNEVQLGDENANPRKKSKATTEQNANKKKKQRRNSLNEGMARSSSSKDTFSKRRGTR